MGVEITLFMDKLSIEDERLLIKIAKNAIRRAIDKKKPYELVVEGKKKTGAEEIRIPAHLNEKRGVFVTIHDANGLLRGCIGFPMPNKPLAEGVEDAAVYSALHDSRFDPVTADELGKIQIEISVLTPPEKINAHGKDLLKEVIIGRHGLIAEYGAFSGLLLPQVPIEEDWDVETFLAQACWKAGLDTSMWVDKSTIFYRFEAQVFAETKSGAVAEKKLLKK